MVTLRQPHQSPSLPISRDQSAVNSFEGKNNIRLFNLEHQVGPNRLNNLPCLGSGYRPEVGLLSSGPRFSPNIDISAQARLEPVGKSFISVGDLDGGGDIDKFPDTETDTTLAINDPGKVGEFVSIHTLIVSQSENKGTIKGVAKGKKHHKKG